MAASASDWQKLVTTLNGVEAGSSYFDPRNDMQWFCVQQGVFELCDGTNRLSSERLAARLLGLSDQWIAEHKEHNDLQSIAAQPPRVTPPGEDKVPAVRRTKPLVDPGPSKVDPPAPAVSTKTRHAATEARPVKKPRLPAKIRGPKIESTAETLRRMEAIREALQRQIKNLRAEIKRLSLEEKDYGETIALLRPLVERRSGAV